MDTAAPKRQLTRRQEQFCREYVVDLNATQAALRAGYSKKTAYSIGHENLKKPEIVARLSELKKESVVRLRSEEELELSADSVLREMLRVAMFRPEDFASVDEKTSRVRYEINRGNLHKLAGIVSLKVRECPPVRVVEGGVEIEREVLEVEFRSDKVRALENLMKHLGILKEKVEIAGMDELIQTLHKGRERVARMKRERDDLGVETSF